MLDKNEITHLIARRIAKEINEGDVVNLGVGIPTYIPIYLPENTTVVTQSENGIMGFGEAPEKGNEDPDLTNAGGFHITEINGTCYTDSAMSFAIIRGGHLDITVLGALEVDQKGNIANWMIPGKFVPGIGGAMDLCAGAKKVISAMTHTDKHGNSKILKECTLPLTGKGKVTLIVTEMAVMEVTTDGLVVREIAEWTNKEDLVAKTDAELIFPESIGTFK